MFMSTKPAPEEVIANLSEFVFTLNDDLEEEYSGIHNLDWIFNTHGWKLAPNGSLGMHSQVYISPCGYYVAKVNIDMDPYQCYAYLAISNPENPYFPNVYWYTSLLRGKNNDWLIKSITLVENLDEIDMPTLEKNKDLYNLHVMGKKNPNGCLKKLLHNQLDIQDESINSVMDGLRYIHSIQPIAVDFIEPRNFMLRGNHPVITDPIW